MCSCAIGFDPRSSDRPVGTAGEADVVGLLGRLSRSGYDYELRCGACRELLGWEETYFFDEQRLTRARCTILSIPLLRS